MVLALGWWTHLLYIKNNDAFYAKVELLKLGMIAEGIASSNEVFYESTAYKQLAKAYQRQQYMIFGEASALVIMLFLGIWLINRSHQREVKAIAQSRNFLLSITHELKSPLASIRLILETFEKRQLDANQTNRLSKNGLRETDRLSDLVNNLLLAAKMEENAYQLSKENVLLLPLLEEIVKNLSQQHPSAQLSIQKDSTSVYEIFADKAAMVSVFMNILENAIKYSNEPQIVTIYLKILEKKLYIKISDNGIGIAQDERENIFKRFYRIGNEDTRRSKGTGLGLYITKQIVEAHAGKIKVEDNTPSGTTFVISLPLVC